MEAKDFVQPDVSDGGVIGSHAPNNKLTTLIGSATGTERNLIRFGLIPLACWRVDDVRFDFDSSMVLPGVRTEMRMLATLRSIHTDLDGRPPVLSLFGHADPVGRDEYNKALSGRRAAAIYGVLTRRTEVWEDLYSNGGVFAQIVSGDHWATRSLQIMLKTISGPTAISENSGTETQQAVRDFQQQNGLKPDGQAGPITRKRLFHAYMDKICLDDLGQPFEINASAGFLGRNADAGGKGDFQGCGEFNPVLIFSEADNQTLERTEDKTPRNAANGPNRRVMALLFRPGSRVTPLKWPCPRAKEESSGCRKRFWSDGEDRRSRRLPDQDREYKQTKDTFACRFYDRLAVGSPCYQHLPFSRQPVYFTISADKVPVLDEPGEGNQIGELAQGTLVRVVAESYSENSFFIRFERTDSDPLTYYEAPRPSSKVEWLCVTKDGEHFAFWSNISSVPLWLRKEADDLDDRFSSSILDI